MAYQDFLSEEGINSQYLLVMKPRRKHTGWDLVSGTVYSSTFSFGHIYMVEFAGTVLAEAASAAAVTNDEWFWDPGTGLLTIEMGGDPNGGLIIISYELYFGTFDAHIGRIPTDSTSRQVYYEPMVLRSPNVQSSNSDVYFGYAPSYSASITISNATKLLQEHVSNASFSESDVDIYHWLDELAEENIKKILNPIVKSISYDDTQTTFSLLDRTDRLNQEYRHQTASGEQFYSVAAFPDLDPNYVDRAIRQVYGVVEGFIPVNIDFVQENPTTSDNRTWVCVAGDTSLGNVAKNVSASGTPTNTSTPFDDASGWQVGDRIYNSTANQVAEITAINTGVTPNIVTHNTWTPSGPADPADSVTRSFVGRLTIITDADDVISPYFGQDYINYVDATNNVAGFQFVNNFETNHSLIGTLKPNYRVFARVYGHQNTTTLGGPSFGSDSPTTGTMTNPIVILLQLLKDIGFSESEIDAASFIAAEALSTEELGFAVPQQASAGSFPTYKELIINILTSILGVMFIDDDLTWNIRRIGPLGSSDKSIADDEIIKASFKYNFDYRDVVSQVDVAYNYQEVSFNGFKFNLYDTARRFSTIAQYIHKIEKSRTFNSYLFLGSDAVKLAERLTYALGDRRGIMTFSTKNRFFNALLNDITEVSRARMPGFTFDDTDKSKDFAIIGTSKSLNNISIDHDDQRGIEENSGSW